MIKFRGPLTLLAIVLVAIGVIVALAVWLANIEGGVSFTATPLTLTNSTAQPGILAQQSTSLNWLDPTSGQSVKKLAVAGLNDVSTVTYDTTNTDTEIYKVAADGKYLALASPTTTVHYGYPYTKTNTTEATISIVDLASGETQTVVKFDAKTALVDIAWDFSAPDVIGFATISKASLNNRYEIMPMEMLYPQPNTNLGKLHLTRLNLRTTQAKTTEYELSNGGYNPPMLIGLNETKFWLINSSLTSVSAEGLVSQESAVVQSYPYYNSANFGNLATNNDHSVVALTADYKIIVYWLKTGQKQELSLAKTGGESVTSLAVSNSGTEIAFVGQGPNSTTESGYGSRSSLWYYNLDTGSSQKLTSWTDTPTIVGAKPIQADLVSRSLVWSPDGKQLAAMLPKSDSASPLAQSELKIFTIGTDNLPSSFDLGATSTRLIRWQ
ncbi:MAG: hypothetical protein Q8Q05_00785 [bacterium]|nr:hypothetical protein [bacterium]